MFGRVGLMVVGLILGFGLRMYGLPLKWAAVIGMLPFAVMEASSLGGPYEKSASEIMHEDTSDRGGPPPGAN
jgi:hypothetical protein